MILDNSINDNFYQKLGALFYSIAAIDKVVHPEEVSTLKRYILEKWKANEDYKDHFGADVIHQMEAVFEWLKYNEINAEEGFQEFKDYFEHNRNLFTIKRKELIQETASKIARSYADINKSELILLSKLDSLFKS